jgi:transmembrane sensor
MSAVSDMEKPREEATQWLILLQEQPNDRALDAAFESWLAASPANAAAWAETRNLGDLIAKNPPKYRDRWMAARRANPARCARRLVAAISILAVAAAIVLALVPNVLLPFTADYATGTAELRAVSLPDGSVVQLAADSAIDVEYAADERRVRLITGGAFFEVKPDAARPFTVSAKTIETTVLGTAFDVRLIGDGAAVAVRHGLVRVKRAGAAAALLEQLGPGDWIRATSSGPAERGLAAPDQAGAWARGELIVRDQPITEIVDQLRGYFRGAIFVTDDDLADRRITGLYDLNDPVQTLRAIALTHDAKLQQISPWVLVLSRN